MDEYKKETLLCIVKIPRATPGDKGNTIMSHKGKGHTKGERLEDQTNEASKQKSV
jgi:hypothetical protein